MESRFVMSRVRVRLGSLFPLSTTAVLPTSQRGAEQLKFKTNDLRQESRGLKLKLTALVGHEAKAPAAPERKGPRAVPHVLRGGQVCPSLAYLAEYAICGPNDQRGMAIFADPLANQR
jgi:hypothetical protein